MGSMGCLLTEMSDMSSCDQAAEKLNCGKEPRRSGDRCSKMIESSSASVSTRVIRSNMDLRKGSTPPNI